MKLLSCEIDLRVGGKYRLVFAGSEGGKPFTFFGEYTVVERPTRLVWTDDDLVEGRGGPTASGGQAVSTLTLDEKHGKTTLVLHQLFPSKEALDGDLARMEQGMRETLAQLEELLATSKID